MKLLGYGAAALFAAMTLAGGQATAANMCRTEHMSCATTMPVDGYCECRTHGNTEDGTVVAAVSRHERINSTAGGCGVNPNSPGCR